MRTLRIVISVILILVSLGLLAFSAAFLFHAFPRDTAPKTQDTTLEVSDTTPEEPEPAEEPPAPAPSQPEPEPEEEPAAEEPSEPDTTDTDDAAAYIQEYLAAMTTEEKVWQLFITTPEGLTGVTTATQAGRPPGQPLPSVRWAASATLPPTWWIGRRPWPCWRIPSPTPRRPSFWAWTRRAAG